MSTYINSPFAKPALLMKGVPAYLIGSFNALAANGNAFLTNSALTSDVVTLSITLLNGPKPAVGNLITVINSTNGSGVFNVNRAIVTGVTWTDSTGSGTVTFALTNSNVTSAADAGSVIIEQAEVGESVTSSGYTSTAVVVQAPQCDSQFTLPLSVLTSPTAITAMTATLQRAIFPNSNAAEWTNTTAVVTIAASAYSAGPTVQATLERGYLYRVNITAVTGSGTVVAKIG